MSNRSLHLALACLALFLGAFAVSVGKPGLPPTLKADEPSYFLMTLSLLHDGDLECETRDYERLFEHFNRHEVHNLILMSDDHWKTVLFGKPYVYPLIAVLPVALLGANGFLVLNMVFFFSMIWMGAAYLSRFNSAAVAFLFSLGFFFLSPTFSYVFWIQPELLNMASLTASYFLVLFPFEPSEHAGGLPRRLWRRIFNQRTLSVWSGAAFCFGAYNKPVVAIVGLPILYLLWRRRGLVEVGRWIAAAAIMMAILVGGSYLLSGHPTAYLGVARAGVKVEDPALMSETIGKLEERLKVLSTTANSWSWMFDPPKFAWPDFFEDLGYFFWGRHTGFLLYMPFALLAIVLFLVHRPRSPLRWAMTLSALAFGIFFVYKVPLNWHGGAGFVGNRYFINIYPLFLFLVTAVRPLWSLPLTTAVGGLFLGTLVFTPFGAPVPEPTLQAHTRSLPYRYFPLELSIRKAVPGYNTMAYHDLAIMARKDVLKKHQPAKGIMWIAGAQPVEALVLSAKPLTSAFFEVRTWAPDNEVVLKLGGDRKTLAFRDAKRYAERNRTVELKPRRYDRITYEKGVPAYVYKFLIDTARGQRIVDEKDPREVFFLGAQFRYLGRREQLARPEHYKLAWLKVKKPETVVAGSTFVVEARVRNLGESPISSSGALPVLLSYHWANAEGERIVFGGRRTRFEGEIQPGGRFQADIAVRAPSEPGIYYLILDAVREPIAWYSDRGGDTKHIQVEVVRDAVNPDSPAP